MANLKVILQTNIKKLGRIADEVNVAAGFARNYLLPRNMAVPASAANREKVASMRAELEAKAAHELEAAKQRGAGMQEMVLNMEVQAMAEGKLYGAVGPDAVAAVLNEQGHDVAAREVLFPEGVIKRVGEYRVILQLHADFQLPITLRVVSDQVVMAEDDAASSEAGASFDDASAMGQPEAADVSEDQA